MAPDGRTEGRTDGRTDMDKPISLRLLRGIITAAADNHYLNMADPTPIAILVPNLLSSKPPPVIPRQLATVPIDVIHIPSTLRMLTSSVLLRRYDTMYGEKFPVKDRKWYFFGLHCCCSY